MIFETLPGFVISRDGYILASEDLRTVNFDSYLRPGVSAICSDLFFYFPISNRFDRLVERNLLYASCELWWDKIKEAELILKSKRSVESKRKAKLLLNAYISRYKTDFDDLTRTTYIDTFVALTLSDRLIEGRSEYIAEESADMFGLKTIKHSVIFNDLPLCKGTDWVIANDPTHSRYLETALRSTSSKEELLALLRKCGAIKVGKWYTKADFIYKHEFYGNIEHAILNKRATLEALISKRASKDLSEIK